TYAWSLLWGPGTASYSVNGTYFAADTIAAVSHAGGYRFLVTVRSSSGTLVASAVDAFFAPEVGGLSIGPTAMGVPTSGTARFVAVARDQFGLPLFPQPAIRWSSSSAAGAIDATGTLHAGVTATATPFIVTARTGARSAEANVVIAAGAAPN